MRPSVARLLIVVLLALNLSTAQDCFHRNRNMPGECMAVDDCHSAVEELRSGKFPQPCDFPNGHTLKSHVCCPGPARAGALRVKDKCDHEAPKQPRAVNCEQLKKEFKENPLATSGRGFISRQMCRKHQLDLCELPEQVKYKQNCGAGGVAANILEFPHMALLGFGKSKEEAQFLCGGSLISPNFILTAAHCKALVNEPVRWALIGATNRTTQFRPGRGEDKDTRQLMEVAEVFVHPGYAPPKRYNDIALLRLTRPVQMKPKNLYPACLNTDVDVDPVGSVAIATGWGQTGVFDDASEQLIKVNLTVRSLQFCKDKVRLKEGELPRGLDDSTHLCAGGGSDGNRDTCQGDSGGPLQIRADPMSFLECMQRIVGVVSFGPLCGLGAPGVYTRVAPFVPWIESIVWPAQQGKCFRWVPLKIDTGTESGDAQEVPNTGPGTVARRMCRAYHVNFCPNYNLASEQVAPELTVDSKCHHQHSRVDLDLWGQKSEPTVTLSYGSNVLTKEFTCSGTLISPRYVLTAAHCTKLGCLSPNQVHFSNPGLCDGGMTYEIERIIVHPDFKEGEPYNDLALIRLGADVDLRDVVPACLHTSMDGKVEGTSAIGSGWSARSKSGVWETVVYRLAKMNLRIRHQKECASLMDTQSRKTWVIGSGSGGRTSTPTRRPGLPRGVLDSQLCAGGLCHNDTYPGNPGGPLQHPMYILDREFKQSHKFPLYRLVGVEAHSPPCGAGLPDVFTRVSSFVDWIESVVWPEGAGS